MKYILVQWPESQCLMEHERFDECLMVDDFDDEGGVGSSAYMCPEDLHDEIFPNQKEKLTLDMIKGKYRRDNICMAEILASTHAEGLSLEEAFEMYVASIKWAEKDRFFHLNDKEIKEL